MPAFHPLRHNRPKADIETKCGTILNYVGLWAMEGKEAELRLKAEHCRRLALGLGDEQTKATLRAMAAEYDEQADEEATFRSSKSS